METVTLGSDNSEEDEEEEEEEDPLYDHRCLPIDQFVMKYLASIILFIFDYDLFAIYKGNYKMNLHLRYRNQYLVPELKMELSRWDVWRSRIRTTYVIWVVFLLIRYSLLCVLQLIIYHLLVSRSDNIGTITNIWINETTNSELLDEQSRSVLKLKYWGELWGNILSDYPVIGLVVYSSLVSSACSAIYFLPHYYHKKPLDSPCMRHAFEPWRELKRVDMLIEQLVQMHSLALKEYEFAREYNRRKGYISLTRSRCTDIRCTFPYVQAIVRRQSSNTPKCLPLVAHISLRPLNYSRYYYLGIWMKSRYLVPAIASTMIASFMWVQIFMITESLRGRCKAKRLNPCVASEAFSWHDWLSVLEVITQMYVTGIVIAINIIVILMSSFTQVALAGNIKVQMEKLLKRLRQWNEERTMLPGNGKDRIGTGFGAHKGAEEFVTNDELMVNTLIKISILSRDMKAESLFMTEMVTAVLGILSCMLLVTLLTGQMKFGDLYGLRVTIMRGVWLMGNIIVIRCAQVYARVLQFDGTIWSIMAQLCIRSCDKTASGAESAHLDYFSSVWRKLVHSNHLTNQENAVRPLGICLTFKKVLEINFFIISLVALLKPLQ